MCRPQQQRQDDRRDRDVRGIRIATTKRRAALADLGPLLGLAALLLAFFLSLYVVRGFRFPVGPDAPVYLWWTRLAGHNGLSAVSDRPGVPALVLVLSGTFRLSPVAVLAGLECVLGACIGLGAAALVRARPDVGGAAWPLTGVLAGVFAVHLATGYLANLAFGALFLAAAAALAGGTRRGAVAAAALLGAGGFAHPLFFLLGLVILALAAAQAFWAERGSGLPPLETEAGRVGLAMAGGGALLGAGLLALLAGPGPLAAVTSKDAFLRRAGLTGELRSAYLDRFVRHWARYVQWASVPLAVAGLRPAAGFVGRLLRAWGVVVIAGVTVALVTGWVPPDRFEAFGYVVPILAALGLVRLWRRLGSRRTIAVLATGALAAAMLLGAAITWRRQAPFISPLEVRRVTDAGRYASGTAPGTPLVFEAESGNDTISFWATRAGNVIRAALPPERIRDVLVTVPGSSASPAAKVEREAWWRLFSADLRAAERRSGHAPTVFILAPLARPVFPEAPGWMISSHRVVTKGVSILGDRAPTPVARPVDPLEPSSPGGIVLATLAAFALLSVTGYGWSRSAAGDGFMALALAPAFGAAGLILAGIALERIGLPLTGHWGPVGVSAPTAAGGYLVAFLLERRSRTHPTPEIEDDPDE